MKILFAALHNGNYRNIDSVVEELAGRGHEREEAAGRQGVAFAGVGDLSHPQSEGPRQHGDDLRLGMGVRRDLIALGQFEPKREQALLAGVAVEHRRLRSRRNRWRCRSPLDVPARDDVVSIHCLGRSLGRYRERQHGQRGGRAY